MCLFWKFKGKQTGEPPFLGGPLKSHPPNGVDLNTHFKRRAEWGRVTGKATDPSISEENGSLERRSGDGGHQIA